MKLNELRNLIVKAKQAYYFGGSPIMSDTAFDKLEEELKKLNPDDPLLKQVGAPISADGVHQKMQHKMIMISQDKVNSAEEFRAWYAKNAKGGKIHASLKLDGSSVAAYYKDGYLVSAATRGDGQEGESIAALVLNFKNLPAYIAGFSGSIRFEAMLTKTDWAVVGGKNPRNMGNGILGRDSGEQSSYITAFAFDVVDDNHKFETETEKSQWLTIYGGVAPWKTCKNADEVVAYFDDFVAGRDKLDVEADGIVIKIDDLAVQAKLGLAPGNKYHKGQVAWKPTAASGITKLIDYELRGGVNGSISPLGIVEPVDIGGTTIRHVYLNNWDFIQEKGIVVGSIVRVSRRNDVIPFCEEVIDPIYECPECGFKGTLEEQQEHHQSINSIVCNGKTVELVRPIIPEPTVCPWCNGPVSRKVNTKGKEGAITVCTNPDCEKKLIRKVKNWFRKTEILGVGESVLEALSEQLNINNAADIYKLGKSITIDEIAEMAIGENNSMGYSRAESLVAEIDKKRVLPLNIFLGSLGVESLDRRRCEIIMEKVPGELDTIDKWLSGKLHNPDFAQKTGVPGIGSVIQTSLEAFQPIIQGLLANGVSVAAAVLQDKPAEGSKIFVITGTLPSGKKKADYKDPLAALGHILLDDVSKDINYLVVANPNSGKPSNKEQKVAKWNDKGADIQVIDEDQLNEIING